MFKSPLAIKSASGHQCVHRDYFYSYSEVQLRTYSLFSLKSCFQPTKSQSTIRHKSSACSQFFKGPIKFFCNAKDKEVKRSAKEDRRKWLKERATTAKKANENGRNKELW